MYTRAKQHSYLGLETTQSFSRALGIFFRFHLIQPYVSMRPAALAHALCWLDTGQQATPETSLAEDRHDLRSKQNSSAHRLSHTHPCSTLTSDLDILLLARALIGGSHGQDAVGINVKLDLDLRAR